MLVHSHGSRHHSFVLTPRGRHVAAAIAMLVAMLTLVAQAQAQTVGTNWSVPINLSQRLDTFSDVPALLCDASQTIHVFWAEHGDGETLIYHRDDAGGSWSSVNDVLVTHSVQELYGVTTKDAAHLIWFTAVRGELYYSQGPLAAVRDARRWTAPLLLANEVDGASIAVDKAGGLHIVYSTEDADAITHVAYYINSHDGGRVWSSPLEVTSLSTPIASAMGVMMAVDGKARLHVVWQLRSFSYGEYSRVGYLRSTDQGTQWGDAVQLAASETAPGVAAPAVYTFADDEVHLTFDIPERLHRWSTDGGATWSQPVTIMKLGAAFGGVNQLVKDSAGAMHVVSAVSDGVYHATWNGSGWDAAESIDRRYYDAHHQQIAVCQGNQLHVIYDDRRGEHEIWYSTRLVNAPHLAQQPITAGAAEATLTPDVPAIAQADMVSTKPARDLAVQIRTPPELWNPVVTPTVLVLGVIAIAVIIVAWRSLR
jgi:hypothetical protein